MKTELYTRKFGENISFTISCWFCQQTCYGSIDEFETTSNFYCRNKSCQTHHLNYIFLENFGHEIIHSTLDKVRFSVNLNSNSYQITYLVNNKEIQVLRRVNLNTADSDSLDFYLAPVFTLPYESLTLTPQNVKDKLPTLLLFL